MHIYTHIHTHGQMNKKNRIIGVNMCVACTIRTEHAYTHSQTDTNAHMHTYRHTQRDIRTSTHTPHTHTHTYSHTHTYQKSTGAYMHIHRHKDCVKKVIRTVERALLQADCQKVRGSHIDVHKKKANTWYTCINHLKDWVRCPCFREQACILSNGSENQPRQAVSTMLDLTYSPGRTGKVSQMFFVWFQVFAPIVLLEKKKSNSDEISRAHCTEK
jgi:hypothetical protein